VFDRRAIALSALSLALLGCMAPPPPKYARIAPQTAVTRARGEQVEISTSYGAPDSVRAYLPTGVTRWVYCGEDGSWSRVFDFDGAGNVLVSLELPGDEDSICKNRVARGRFPTGE